MKAALKEGSISLSPGGMREGLYKDTTLLSRRRGIFKMALETGTPLVPIVSRGYEQISQCIDLPSWIQDYLEPYDMCFFIPTWKTIMRCLGIAQYPLKDPVFSVIGEPMLVEKVEVPTEEQISELREKYCEALKSMYKKEIGRELTVAP
jgi:1-acyl-sn-glycerol-3-phosphate acyltransferase